MISRTLGLVRVMMECRRVRPLLQSYLDGELTEADAVVVSRHLDACRRCGLAAETYQEIKAGLSRLAEEPAPDAVSRLRDFVDSLDEGDSLRDA